MAKRVKRMVAAVAFMVIGSAIFSQGAFAECGPGFSSKSQLISYYKHNPAAAHGLRKELLKHSSYTGYQADETVLNWLRSPEQKVFAAPSGYVLNKNTYCPGGPGKYKPYNGLLTNMGGKPMLWHCDKEGHNCVPILKGYCMNFVMGPPVKKHKPPKHKPKKPHKCGCKKHKPPKPKPTCEAQGMITVAGNCVSQSNNAKQECDAKVGGTWNGSQCVIVQINNNCGNVNVGNEGNTTVTQGDNCNTIVEEKPCNCTPPPCECKPEEPKEPKQPVVEWERIQEVYVNKTRNLCVTVTPTSAVSEVQFGVKWGERSNGGKGVYNASTNKYCVTYTAPSEEPPHTCEEPISDKLPPGTKCDIANVAVFCKEGFKTVYAKMEIPILDAEKNEEIVW